MARFAWREQTPMPGAFGGSFGPRYEKMEFDHRPYETPAWMRRQGDELGLQRQQISNSLLGQLARSQGDFSYSRTPTAGVPAPSYIGTGGVYSQGQVNAMSNLQRGNLQQQAGTLTNNFASSLGARGFSPMGSPMLDFYSQAANMRANAGAASNETNLNFNAAKANRDASIAASGVNANLYGSYTDALSRLADIQMRGQMQSQTQKYDLLRSLLG
jgi:hypothetical protein